MLMAVWCPGHFICHLPVLGTHPQAAAEAVAARPPAGGRGARGGIGQGRGHADLHQSQPCASSAGKSPVHTLLFPQLLWPAV